MSHRFQCKKVRESKSGNAILVVDVQSGEEIWFPFSQVISTHFDKSNDGEMVVSDWIAKEKGLL